jgi:hypothetical protein
LASDYFRREEVEIIRTQIFAAEPPQRTLSLQTFNNMRMRSVENSRFARKNSQVENRLNRAFKEYGIKREPLT